MAKIRIVSLAGLDVLQIDSGVRRQIERETADTVAKTVAKRLEAIAQGHHNNLINEMRLKLRGLGMPVNTFLGGSKSLSVGTVSGKLLNIKTDYWKPLTKRYQNRAPVNLTFWRKESRLVGAFSTMMRGLGPVRAQELKAKRNHHKGRVNTVTVLKFPLLNFPFERGVSLPFLTGSERISMVDPSQPINRKGLGRARFAEQNDTFPDRERPFMRRMSAFLGKAMRKDITSKLRKL
jgi:hypothetical protein